jgi:hypothetical protein
LVIAVADLANAELGPITPNLTAPQLTKLVAYEQEVTALTHPGYLTAEPASTLAGHAQAERS